MYKRFIKLLELLYGLYLYTNPTKYLIQQLKLPLPALIKSINWCVTTLFYSSAELQQYCRFNARAAYPRISRSLNLIIGCNPNEIALYIVKSKNAIIKLLELLYGLHIPYSHGFLDNHLYIQQVIKANMETKAFRN